MSGPAKTDPGAGLYPATVRRRVGRPGGIVLAAWIALSLVSGCSGSSTPPPASISTGYAIPADNPFVGVAGYRPEIWALGLRNPWRFSFDRVTGDLYLGDVGQGAFEEIDFQPAGDPGGQNYGWNVMEGSNCYNSATCNTAGLTLPVITYDHPQGQNRSVTGGVVYRGAITALQGIYFYGDFSTGLIWGLRKNGAGWDNALLLASAMNVSTFGEDEDGNVYLANHANGDLLKIDSLAAPAPGGWPQISLTGVAGGFAQPVHVTHAGDGSGRVFVVEQGGRIRILDNGVVLPTPFLDIASRLVCCFEQGLLSVAFPPGFAAKRHFYVYYTRASDGALVVARYRVSAGDGNVADPATGEVILVVPHPGFGNHNGGQLAFGPDGYLYLGTGDGGGGGDPGNNAQNPGSLLGKILRIDVESVTN